MDRLKRIPFPIWTIPLALLAAIALAYGVLMREQGFYWDDWFFVWIAHFHGREGFAEYFSTNRPLRTYFYAALFPLLGERALAWQLFAMAWRWLSGVALWWALRLAWPKRTAAITGLALLFLVYPGFGQQFIAVNYSNFFFLETLFFVSLALMLTAARRPDRTWPLTIAGVTLSALHLFSLEYFALQDLLRPLLLWIVLSEAFPDRRERVRRMAAHWLPYALVFAAYIFWRVFIFKFQTYQPELINQAGAAPSQTLATLPVTMLNDLILTSFGAWADVFRLPDPVSFGAISTGIYAALVLIGLVGFGFFLARLAAQDGEAGAGAARRRQALVWIGLGVVSMLLAGAVFWVLQLQIRLGFPNDRFTLPFALGVSFVLIGLIELLPARRWLQAGLVAVLVAGAIGTQFRNANAYRRDWETQKDFFWQMTWRAPGLKPGTLLLSYESPLTYFTDNSLTAPLNWIYAPGNFSERLDVAYFFISVRLGGSLPALEKDIPIEHDYLGPLFTGSTSQMIVIHDAPPGCLRILDPERDVNIPLLPPLTREAAPLSNLEQIIAAPSTPAAPPAAIFGAEPPHGWCYYFEKAGLAAQLGDWAEVARLGDRAFALGDYPNEASERVVFVEGYARTGRIKDANRLTREAIRVTPLTQRMLCQAWGRAGRDVADAAQAAASMRAELQCTRQ